MGRLTEQQKQFFKDKGYIVLKNIFTTEELDAITEQYDGIFKRCNIALMENSWIGLEETNRVNPTPFTVKGIHNLQLHHVVFSKLFLFNDNLLDALEDVMNTKNIMLHHTKAHFKPPENGAAYPLHQDYHYFPYQKDSSTAVFLNLDAADPSNGGLVVYPGSHKLGPLEDVGAKEGNYHYIDYKKYTFEGATPVVAERGDVVIFHYMLIHGSPLNLSDRPRRMLLMQVLDADDKPAGDQYTQPCYGLMLRGINISKQSAVSTRFDSL